ncbi:MAG: hypothetical protein ABSH26_06310 [Opitutaceae bacterium]
MKAPCTPGVAHFGNPRPRPHSGRDGASAGAAGPATLAITRRRRAHVPDATAMP